MRKKRGLSTEELVESAEHHDVPKEMERAVEEQDEPEGVVNVMNTDDIKGFIAYINAAIEECSRIDNNWERANFVGRSL